MSLFANLKGDKRSDKDTLSDIKNLLGEKLFAAREKEALDFGRVLYSALKLNGKVRAAKAWDKLKYEEKLRWGGIAVDVFFSIEASRTGKSVEDILSAAKDLLARSLPSESDTADLKLEVIDSDDAGAATDGSLASLFKSMGQLKSMVETESGPAGALS